MNGNKVNNNSRESKKTRSEKNLLLGSVFVLELQENATV